MGTKARSRKVQLILNGKVAGNDALRTAVAQQRAVGHSIEVRVTLGKGDARRFVTEAGELDLLVAAGGDGTLNEVVHGLMALSTDARPVLGVVPLGTANDFATGCDIPRDPHEALALCMEGEGVPIDVGKANEDEPSSVSWKAHLAGSRNHWQRPGGDRREWAPDGWRHASHSSRTY